MNADLQILDHLAKVEDPDPALIPLQYDAIKLLQDRRKNGTQEEIDNALDVAQELGALRLVL